MNQDDLHLDPAHFVPKELSWLAFNGRLLQEAADPEVPLIERVKFLGIYSANLDEFYRVRVATLRRLVALGSKGRGLTPDDPAETLDAVVRETRKQHQVYNRLYRATLEELADEGIHFVDETELDEAQANFVVEYFRRTVRQRLHPIMTTRSGNLPPLEDDTIYLAVVLRRRAGDKRAKYALIQLPTDVLPRFLVLPSRGDERYLIYLDDVIRYNLAEVFALFRYDHFEAYTIKFSKDAELDLDDDIESSYFHRIERSLKRRIEGEPVRFVYDERIPESFLDLLLSKLSIPRTDSLIAGGRYHNRSDLVHFPKVGHGELRYAPIDSVSHPVLEQGEGILRAIRSRDVLLHFPYHSFDYVLTLLREAAIDPKVREIRICLYRVADNSAVIEALINALRNGKDVTVVMELQARFDEEANLEWTEILRAEGARVSVGVPGLKVHAKVLLISRKEKGQLRDYACIGTGNFNEETATHFSDMLLMTADPEITHEVFRVFRFIHKPYKRHEYHHLLVSPFSFRRSLEHFIDAEIEAAREGRPSGIDIKLNNFSDPALVARLYRASQAGVPIRLNVRSMHSLRAGIEGVSENIEAMAILDRYLEHARILRFHNRGDERVYIGSADWLPRNLDKRIEVMVPIYDDTIRQQITALMDTQWRDNVKARILDADLSNRKRPRDGGPRVHAQIDHYELYRPAPDPV